MSKKWQYGSVGSVSTATMRPEDLIPSFCSELRFLGHRSKELTQIERRLAREENHGCYGHKCYWDDEFLDEDLESLFDMLNEHALPYMYFGSHPGDGADYGFWVSESLEYDFDGIIQDEDGEFYTGYDSHRESIGKALPKRFTGEVLSINDHGNMTLYSVKNGRWNEIWAVV